MKHIRNWFPPHTGRSPPLYRVKSQANVIVSDGFAVLVDYFIKAFEREAQTKFVILLRQNTKPPKLKKTVWELQSQPLDHDAQSL